MIDSIVPPIAMRALKLLLAVMTITSILVLGAGTVAADTEVGVSGSCDDEGEGPDDAFEGEGGTEVDTGDGANDEVEDAISNPGGDQLSNTGFIHFAIGEAQGYEDACDRDNDQESNGDDYLEAHAQVGNQQGIAFCQSEGHKPDGHIHPDYDGSHHNSNCSYDTEGNHDGSGSSDNNNDVEQRVSGTTP